MPAAPSLTLPVAAVAATWTEFDPGWYRATYGAAVGPASGTDAALLQFHQDQGQRLGHAPNPFFDETWYLRAHPDVAAAVAAGLFASGFDHYRQRLPEDRAPHWLFDPVFHAARSPALTPEWLQASGFANGYDHFLRCGDAEGQAPGPFFSPAFYLSALGRRDAEAVAEGALRHYLRRFRISLPEMQTSACFDPAWYLRRYPEVSAEVAQGIWRSALAHYLANATPLAFDPLPVFSEADYLRLNPDVAQAIGAPGGPRSGGLRSGYQHFLRHGIRELRPFHPRIDLRHYVHAHPSVPFDLEQGRAPDAFTHLLTIGAARGLSALPADPPFATMTEDQAAALWRQAAVDAAPLHRRRPIDFSCAGTPQISVVMALRDRLPTILATLSALRSGFPGAVDLVLVACGPADGAFPLERYVRGARHLRCDADAGFVQACNAGLAAARADAVLFLHDDVLLDPGAIEAALARLAASPDIGAVGGKVIRPHGRLQEAGNIIWRDGHTAGYQRDAAPLAPEADFVRDVDFCSAVFLLVRGPLLRDLGGFDADYAPDGYEDADLCARILQAGQRVTYDPAVSLRHLEDGSAAPPAATTARVLRNRALFQRKHAAWLARQPDRDRDGILAARSRGRPAHRILILAETIPLRVLGADHGRIHAIIALLAEIGCEVALFPLEPRRFETTAIRADFPDTVEVLHDFAIGDLPAFLDARPGHYDTIWVSGTGSLDRARDSLARLQAAARCRIILDTGSIDAIRQGQRVALDDAALPFDAEEALRVEFCNASLCDAILTTSKEEAGILRRRGLGPIAVLGQVREPDLTPRGFADRHGLLLVGALHGEDSPHHDALRWFVDRVLPLVALQLGDAARLTVAGHSDGNADLHRFATHPRLTLLHGVAESGVLHDRHRILVAPARIAAGLPGAIHDAAGFGLPVVASGLLRDQLGWRDGEELLAADSTDPVDFADRIVTLYRSELLWQRLRQAAADRLARENGRAAYRQALEAILLPAAEPSLGSAEPG